MLFRFLALAALAAAAVVRGTYLVVTSATLRILKLSLIRIGGAAPLASKYTR